jgi:hypothetical protein
MRDRWRWIAKTRQSRVRRAGAKVVQLEGGIAAAYRSDQLVVRSSSEHVVAGALRQLGVTIRRRQIESHAVVLSYTLPPEAIELRNQVCELIDCQIHRVSPHYFDRVATLTVGPAGHPQPVEEFPSLPADPELGKGTTVAIIDTGIVDKGRLPEWLRGEVDAAPEDIDSLTDTSPGTLAGHGTFVAGLVRQVAPRTRLVVRGPFGPEGLAEEWAVLQGVRSALEAGADVLLLPFGTYSIDGEPPELTAPLSTALRDAGRPVVAVAAAGNDASEVPLWPAALSDVVAVGALGGDGKPAAFSNRGRWIDAWAPGEGLVSAYPLESVAPAEDEGPMAYTGAARWSGTSLAAAVVAGMLAERMSSSGLDAVRARDIVLEELDRRLYGAGPMVSQGAATPPARLGPDAVEEARSWRGLTLFATGEPVGRIDAIYLDRSTRKPEWVLVHTGLFGNSRTFVPLADATRVGDTVRVPHDPGRVREAPRLAPDVELSESDEAQLYAHYGIDYSTAVSPSGLPAGEAGTDATATTLSAGISGETTAELIQPIAATRRLEADTAIVSTGRDAGRSRRPLLAGLGAVVLAAAAAGLALLRARRRRPPILGDPLTKAGRDTAGSLTRAAGAARAVAGLPTAGGARMRRLDLGRRGRQALKQARQAVPRRRRRPRMKVMGKLGMAVGAAVGYVLGVKAGRERYEQITASARQLLDKPQVKRVVDSAPGNLGARVEQVANKAADKVQQAGDKVAASGSSGTTGATTGPTTTTTPSVPSTSGGSTTTASTETGTTKRSSAASERRSKSS